MMMMIKKKSTRKEEEMIVQQKEQQCHDGFIIGGGEEDDEEEEEEEDREDDEEIMKSFLPSSSSSSSSSSSNNIKKHQSFSLLSSRSQNNRNHHHHDHSRGRNNNNNNNNNNDKNNNLKRRQNFVIRISCYVIALFFLGFVVVTINNSSINLLWEEKANNKQPNTIIITENQHQQNNQYQYDYDWNDIRETLCPNYHPNLDLGNILFDIARKEIITSDTEEDEKEITTTTNTEDYQKEVKRFYSGTFVENPLVCKTPPNNNNNGQQTTTVAYVAIWKAANDVIRGFMEKSSPSNNKDVINNSSSSSKPYLDCNRDITYNDLMMMNNKQQQQEEQEEDNNLCLITAIRDPISHFLSGYNEIEYRLGVQNKVDTNSSYIYKVIGSEERFIQFVTDLLVNPKQMYYGVHRHVEGVYHHIRSMSRILPILNQYHLTSKLQYLPSITNLSYTFPKFLKSSCGDDIPDEMVNQSKPKHLINGKHSHKSSNDPLGSYRAAKSVWKSNGPTSRALCVLHSMDYACWRDLPQDDDDIPDVCKEIYSSKRFIVPLMNGVSE